MRTFWEIVILLSVITAFIFGAVILANQWEKKICKVKTEMMELEHSYGFYPGCMVKVDGKWQPFNEYNTINLNQ